MLTAGNSSQRGGECAADEREAAKGGEEELEAALGAQEAGEHLVRVRVSSTGPSSAAEPKPVNMNE